jgi:hypothetical protein
MIRELEKITRKLKNKEITEDKAKTLLMFLFDVIHTFTKDDMRQAFEGGRDSKEPCLKYERWGDMEPYASSEIVKSFKQWIHENYK